MKNLLMERLSAKQTALGTWITIGNADVVNILAGLDFEFFVFDTEHSPISTETVSHLIQVLDEAKTTRLVRIPSNNEVEIKKALDMGGQGVIVPFINTRAEAEKAVAYAKYPPTGVRGHGPRKAAGYGLDSDYLRTANAQTLVFAIVESGTGMENIDAIVRTSGLNGVIFGFADFSLSIGLTDFSDPKVDSAKRTVVESCERHGKIPGIYAPSLEMARDAASMGFRLIAAGSDFVYLLDGARHHLKVMDSIRNPSSSR